MGRIYKHLPTRDLEYSRELTYFYHEYNNEYFGGRLVNLEVYFRKMPKSLRYVRYGYTAIPDKGDAEYIVINKELIHWYEIARIVLLHEMIHVRYPHIEPDHGKLFQKEKRRLIIAGAFDNLI